MIARVQGDIRISDDRRSVVMASGLARVAQRMRIGLQTLQGSWRWDLNKGVPFISQRVEKLTKPILHAMITKFLMSFPEVLRIIVLTIEVDSDGLATANYTVQCKDNQTLSESVQFVVVNR